MSQAAAAAAEAKTRICSVRRKAAGRGLRGWGPGPAGTDGARDGELRVRSRPPAGEEEMRVRRWPGGLPCCGPSRPELSGLKCFSLPPPQPEAAAGRAGVCQVNSAPSHSSVGSTNPAAGVELLHCHCRPACCSWNWLFFVRNTKEIPNFILESPFTIVLQILCLIPVSSSFLS